MEWLCTPNPVVRYTNSPDEKLKSIIQLHGFAFDENWWYWIPPKNQNIVKKAPIWLYPQKGVAAEKSKKFIKGKQTKLNFLT